MAAIFVMVKIRFFDQNGKFIKTTESAKDLEKLSTNGLPHLNWAVIDKLAASYSCQISQATCEAIMPWVEKKNHNLQYLPNLLTKNFTSNGSVPKTENIINDIQIIFKDYLNENQNCLIISDKKVLERLLGKKDYKEFDIKHLDVIKITSEKPGHLTYEKVKKHVELAV